jgi:hypothetical protein
MAEIIEKCLCGSLPVVDRKTVETDYGTVEVFKYRCPVCCQKELPWLGQWHDCGAREEWNRIAPKRSYHKRTLEYNMHGVCIAEPYKVYEWRDKKRGYEHLTVKIYRDNSVFYYCRDYHYKTGGSGSGLWIGSPGYPSLEEVKRRAMREIIKGRKDLVKIAKELLSPEFRQGELF